MDPRHFSTVACTDLASDETTTIHQEKTIPFVWSIKNFNQRELHLIISGGKLGGPTFKFHPLSEELWRLEIVRPWNHTPFSTSLKLDITKVSACNSTAKQFTVCWSAEGNEENNFLKKNVTLAADVGKYEVFACTPSDFIKYIFKGACVCNMVIQIEIDDDVAQRSVDCVNRTLLFKDKLAVLADMENILKEAKLTDITLRSEGKEMRAHRAILAGRSPVFESMFEHQMSEKASGSVDITNVPYDILQLLVTYMYTGRLVDLDVKSASELFVASDKYAVEVLHDTCSLFLKRNFTAENCLEILMLADTHSNEDLKSSAVSYFSRHSNDICQIPDWENVIAARPHIHLELLKVLAKK